MLLVYIFWILLVLLLLLVILPDSDNDGLSSAFGTWLLLWCVIGVAWNTLTTQRETVELIPRSEYAIFKKDDYVVFQLSKDKQITSDKYKIVVEPEKAQLWKHTAYNHYDWKMGTEITFEK